jgi:hypothetical protein
MGVRLPFLRNDVKPEINVWCKFKNTDVAPPDAAKELTRHVPKSTHKKKHLGLKS